MHEIVFSRDAILDLSSLLLAASDSAARARLIAAAVVEELPDSACVVHRFLEEGGEGAWNAIGVAGDVSIEQSSLPSDSGLIVPLLSSLPQVLFYGSDSIRREDYSHLHVTRSIASLAYVPLVEDDRLTGVIEVVGFSDDLRPQDLAKLDAIVYLASPAILAGEAFELQRQNLLDSVHRMSQLYDLEKSLNSTLELDSVIALIPVKVAGMLSCQAIHVWLFDGEVLRLVASSGHDATVQTGMTQSPGEGYVADMAEEGEPLLIADAGDERLRRRNAAIAATDDTPPVAGALLVPLLQDGAEVGVLEAINKNGSPFDEDDEFFLTTVAETVSSALKNASLMFAERKLEILEALVRVSSEITSTLRLDRLLQIIVNSPQNVLPFELCAIALDNRGRLQLKAVSGMATLPLGDAQVDRMHDLVRWLSTQPESQHLRQPGGSAASDLPADVARHFEATGYRALYSLPLADDQGRVGLLLYESSDSDFLDLPHTEMIKILAAQATVAIRNALLYREVPLINLLEPLMHKKQALLRSSRGRRLGIAAAIIVVALFLVLCPLPMRITGPAIVAAQHRVTIAAPVDGNVTAVFVHEGQRVAAGQVLGAMNDWQWRTDLAASEARYKEAMLVMESDLARGSSKAGADRAQMEYLRSEAERARTRLESAQLRSPIAGIVVTPFLRNAAGEHLDAGAAFAQVLDLSSAVVDIAVPQSDVALIRPGQSAAIKLDSYPQISWHHAVAVVSAQAQAGNGDRSFAARVPLPNSDAMLRAGMTGQRENLHRVSTCGLCPAPPARTLDMANLVELDWLVMRMNPPCSRSMLSATAVVAMAVLLFSSGCAAHPAAQAASQATVKPCSETASIPESAAPSFISSPVAASRPSATQDTNSFTTTGPLVAVQQADVAAARDGRVVSIAVEIGDRVQRGQLLALLDNRALLSASDAQKARVASLQAEVRDWQAEQKSVELDLHRADQLRADKIISQESWEHVKYKLDETIAEGARYRADEAEAEDDLNSANLQLEQSRVVAPFAGVVGRSSLRIAQQVKQGDVLFWITAVSPLRILFTVPESAMAAFHAGARLELTTFDYPGLRQPARILRVSPVVDPASGSVQIIGAVVHPSRLLKPGMSMQVRLAP